jgi:hypothetical protein
VTLLVKFDAPESDRSSLVHPDEKSGRTKEKSCQNNACLVGSRASSRIPYASPIVRQRLADGEALF